MFRALVLIVRKEKLYYTVSGIITHIGGRPVHRTATYKCDDTGDCIIQFALLTMSACARNMQRLEINLLSNLVHQVG